MVLLVPLNFENGGVGSFGDADVVRVLLALLVLLTNGEAKLPSGGNSGKPTSAQACADWTRSTKAPEVSRRWPVLDLPRSSEEHISRTRC